MILKLAIIITAVGLLSIGGIAVTPTQKTPVQENEQVKIIDGVQYIDIKTPVIIRPST